MDSLVNVAIRYRDRVDPALMLPQVDWRQPRNARRIPMNVGAKSTSAGSNGDGTRIPVRK